MRQKIDLLNGPVFPSLAKLAVPIMATSLVQMAYNLTDMIWIGRIGSTAVASVGAWITDAWEVPLSLLSALPACICGLPMALPSWQKWADK